MVPFPFSATYPVFRVGGGGGCLDLVEGEGRGGGLRTKRRNLRFCEISCRGLPFTRPAVAANGRMGILMRSGN